MDLDNAKLLDLDNETHVDLESAKLPELEDLENADNETPIDLDSAHGSVDHSVHLKYVNIKTMESVMFARYDNKMLPRHDESTVNVNLMLSLRTIVEFVRNLASFSLLLFPFVRG